MQSRTATREGENSYLNTSVDRSEAILLRIYAVEAVPFGVQYTLFTNFQTCIIIATDLARVRGDPLDGSMSTCINCGRVAWTTNASNLFLQSSLIGANYS